LWVCFARSNATGCKQSQGAQECYE
jgi:hypothetical protein